MQYALFNGDKTTGLCIQKMVKKMDAGNIVKKKEIKININKLTLEYLGVPA